MLRSEVIVGALKRAFPSGPAVRRLPMGLGRGLRLEIDFRDQTQLYLGLYEVELSRHLRRLCRPGMPSFDVGGAHGYDALVLAKLSHAHVVTFEQDARLTAQIGRALEANGALAALVTIQQATVAAASEPAQGVTSLDDAAQELGVWPDFVKIDIEGAEGQALAGAQRILDRRPNLLIETHSAQAEAECMDVLRPRGYRPIIVERRRWLPEHRPLSHNRWLVAEGRAG